MPTKVKRTEKEYQKGKRAVFLWLPIELCDWAKAEAKHNHRGNVTWFIEDALVKLRKKRR